MNLREVSLWFDTLSEPVAPRPGLPGDLDVDVCVVGAGFTGLWTAYSLAELDPGLRIAVVEARTAGFGASGRNGGWCSGLFPTAWPAVADEYGADAAVRLRAALADTVDEVGRFCAKEGVDAHYVKGGTLTLARSAAQERRLRAEAETWLDAGQVRSRLAASSVRGALFDPDCAALHPGRLVRGLAAAAVRRGVALYEDTPVRSIEPGVVTTDRGRVRAEVVVRATEGFTASLPGLRRRLVPVYSLVIATEPLPASFWDEVGWSGRETLTDGRHLIIYAQRTADDRIVLGGRGAPYHLASRVRPAFDREPRVFDMLHRTLVDLFPAARDAAITHRWGGPLGIPRDWFPFVRFDPASGMAEAGGYVGDGVAATNLAGRTLAELICRRETERTDLPWVNRPVRNWEPEPLRWLGVNGVRTLVDLADKEEARTGRSSVLAAVTSRLVGGH